MELLVAFFTLLSGHASAGFVWQPSPSSRLWS
jgi:hypothetical protein